MTAREFRKFKSEKKLTVEDLANIIDQSTDMVYKKLRGVRQLNSKETALIRQHENKLANA